MIVIARATSAAALIGSATPLRAGLTSEAAATSARRTKVNWLGSASVAQPVLTFVFH